MRILLIHALKSESDIIRKAYGTPESRQLSPGISLASLHSRVDILRTGVGMKQIETALKLLPDSNKYGQFIHFGVSGALSDRAGVGDIVMASRYLAADQPALILPTGEISLQGKIPVLDFFSTDSGVLDEASRSAAHVWGGEAVDMESYAVAQYCVAKTIPLLALRVISDRAGDTARDDFKHHYRAAAEKLQNFLLAKVLPPS